MSGHSGHSGHGSGAGLDRFGGAELEHGELAVVLGFVGLRGVQGFKASCVRVAQKGFDFPERCGV